MVDKRGLEELAFGSESATHLCQAMSLCLSLFWSPHHSICLTVWWWRLRLNAHKAL